MKFKANSLGGIDIYNGKDKFLLHLSTTDIKEMLCIQQHQQDVATIRDRVSSWVEKQINEDYDFSDLNSRLFSDDEISIEEICQKILDDAGLIESIVLEYRDILDSPQTEQGLQTLYYADEAIGTYVSIKDIMGEILYNKHPKEFCVGKWKVAVVEQGDYYGENGSLKHEHINPVVEFYDMSVDKKDFPNGQFTGGRYFLDSLLTSEFGPSLDEKVNSDIGLDLYSGVPEWIVEPGDLAVIAVWLHKVKDNLVEKTQENVMYHGEVDVPFGNGKLAEIGFEDDAKKAAEGIVKARLNAIPEFNNVTAETFGQYDNGLGVSFTFTTTADVLTSTVLLQHALYDMKYEFYHDDAGNTLETTLSEAQERSRQQSNDKTSAKEDIEFNK